MKNLRKKLPPIGMSIATIITLFLGVYGSSTEKTYKKIGRYDNYHGNGAKEGSLIIDNAFYRIGNKISHKAIKELKEGQEYCWTIEEPHFSWFSRPTISSVQPEDSCGKE